MKKIATGFLAVVAASFGFAGPGTVRITEAYSVNPCVEGLTGDPYVLRTSEPWYAYPGYGVVLVVSRIGGSSGRIAVKYKTQTSTAICGTDFDYVKDVLVWEDGDDTDRYIDIPTSMFSTTGCGGFRPCNCVETPDGYLCTSCLDYYNCPRTLQMRIKFVKMATGQYYGCRVPVIENNKVYMTIDYGSTTR